MSNEKETKGKLLESAKKEFMEKGYMQSSLRTICKNAGVTTGALYFFFKDKEDLFASLVDKPLNILFEMMNNHYRKELESEEVIENALNGNHEDDIKMSREIITFLYRNYDEFILLLQKSQGSKYEKCIDEFIFLSEKHYQLLADKFSIEKGLQRIDNYIIHWIAHMQIDSIVYMLSHEKSEKAAVKNFESMARYLIAGWMSLYQDDKKA